MNGALSKVRELAGKECMSQLHHLNAPLIMAKCGSKGGQLNISQMAACVGLFLFYFIFIYLIYSYSYSYSYSYYYLLIHCSFFIVFNLTITNINNKCNKIGQQTIMGSRIPNGFINRTLPHFLVSERSPASKGFYYFLLIYILFLFFSFFILSHSFFLILSFIFFPNGNQNASFKTKITFQIRICKEQFFQWINTHRIFLSYNGWS